MRRTFLVPLALGALPGCSAPAAARSPEVIETPFVLADIPLTTIVDALELHDGGFLVTGIGDGPYLCRLQPTGALDESFGDGGCLSQDIVYSDMKPAKVATAGTRIDVFGTWVNPPQTQVFAIHMNTLGEVYMTMSGNYGEDASIVEVLEHRDANVYVGHTPSHTFLVRHTIGSIDVEFGNNGFARVNESPARDAVLLKGDRFVVSTGTRLHAIDSSGSREERFGVSGTVDLPFEALTLTVDGSSIIAAGPGMAVARISYDGLVTEMLEPMDAGHGAIATPYDVTMDGAGAILLGGIVSSTADAMALGHRTRGGNGALEAFSEGRVLDVDVLRGGGILLAGTRDGSAPAMSIVTAPFPGQRRYERTPSSAITTCGEIASGSTGTATAPP